MLPIREWPEEERPREKLLNRGSKALSDAELLAIFLRTGTQGRSAIDVGRELVQEYGSLRGILNAPQAELCRMKGLGPAKFALLQAALEIGRRYLGEELSKDQALTSPDAVKTYLTACMRDLQQEVFACLFLDNRHRVIVFEELFYGTVDGTSVHPREVVKRALAHNATAVILAHNHPSGVAEPSQADKNITSRLVDALRLVDIRVLDHFIIGDGVVTSFSESGLL